MLPGKRNQGGTLEVPVRMMTDYANIARPMCAPSMAKCLRVDLVHDGPQRRYAAMHCMLAIHILDGESFGDKVRTNTVFKTLLSI